MEAEPSKQIEPNSKISSPALARTLKSTRGVEISECTANRVRSDVLGRDSESLPREYQVLDIYCRMLGKGPSNIVECSVSTLLGLQVLSSDQECVSTWYSFASACPSRPSTSDRTRLAVRSDISTAQVVFSVLANAGDDTLLFACISLEASASDHLRQAFFTFSPACPEHWT